MLTIYQPPAVEPVSLEEAKVHLREDNDGQDDWITEAIVEARCRAEKLTGRALITTSVILYLDAFYDPRGCTFLERYPVPTNPYGEIELRICPVKQVAPLFYTGVDGTPLLHELFTDAFQQDVLSEPGRIRPLVGQCWPVTQAGALNAVKIPFTAGYGDDPADVPPAFKKYILARVGFFYQHRGDDNAKEPEFLDCLLEEYRWSRVV